jgi:hypothetical protein
MKNSASDYRANALGSVAEGWIPFGALNLQSPKQNYM